MGFSPVPGETEKKKRFLEKFFAACLISTENEFEKQSAARKTMLSFGIKNFGGFALFLVTLLSAINGCSGGYNYNNDYEELRVVPVSFMH